MNPPPPRRGRKAGSQDPQPRPNRRTAQRKRTALACEECRSRKRRCDGVIPACGGCTKRRSQCIYSAEVEAREWNQRYRNPCPGPPAAPSRHQAVADKADSMIHSLKQRLESLERAAENPTGGSGLELPGPPLPSTENLPSEPPSSWRLDQENRTQASSLPGNSEPLQEDAPATSLSTCEADAFNCEAATPLSCSTKFEQDSSRCIRPGNFERLMKPIGRAVDQKRSLSQGTTSSGPEGETSHTPVFVPQMSCPIACACRRLLNAERWQLPLRREADSLVAIYFARHARMFPVLHRPSFMKQYEALWGPRRDSSRGPEACVGLCRQKSKGKLFQATVNAVFAIAALFSSRIPERNAAYASDFFRRAESINVMEMLNDEVGLEFVQLTILMAFYTESTERFSKCWNVAGLALRMARNMGLHLSIAEARKRDFLAAFPTQLECEMRSRIWYLCVLLETEVSMTFAQPLMLPVGASSVKLPEAIDDTLLSDELGKWNVQPSDNPSLMEYYVHALKLYDILGQAMERQESTTESATEASSILRGVMSLDNKIVEWHYNLPPYLSCDKSRAECDPLKDIPTLDPVPDTEVVLGFPDLATRLHCRYLSVRQIILRPVLDLFFEKQQNEKITKTESVPKGTVEGSVIANIATQCVMTAVELVEFLADQIQNQTFVCWWYNIHYLHTSGSTILLGRLCSIPADTESLKALGASWELCLHHLGRYNDMSTIAQKSSQVLQESAKRLLEDESLESTVERNHSQATKAFRPEKTTDTTTTMALTAQFPLDGGSLGNDFVNEESLQAPDSFENMDMWNNASFESWAFMMPISQLETFPIQSEAPDLGY